MLFSKSSYLNILHFNALFASYLNYCFAKSISKIFSPISESSSSLMVMLIYLIESWERNYYSNFSTFKFAGQHAILSLLSSSLGVYVSYTIFISFRMFWFGLNSSKLSVRRPFGHRSRQFYLSSYLIKFSLFGFCCNLRRACLSSKVGLRRHALQNVWPQLSKRGRCSWWS